MFNCLIFNHNIVEISSFTCSMFKYLVAFCLIGSIDKWFFECFFLLSDLVTLIFRGLVFYFSEFLSLLWSSTYIVISFWDIKVIYEPWTLNHPEYIFLLSHQHNIWNNDIQIFLRINDFLLFQNIKKKKTWFSPSSPNGKCLYYFHVLKYYLVLSCYLEPFIM